MAKATKGIYAKRGVKPGKPRKQTKPRIPSYMIDAAGDFCGDIFWGPNMENLECERDQYHEGNHVCFRPDLGIDGVVFEWPDTILSEDEFA